MRKQHSHLAITSPDIEYNSSWSNTLACRLQHKRFKHSSGPHISRDDIVWGPIGKIIVPQDGLMIGNRSCGKNVWRNGFVAFEQELVRKVSGFGSNILAMKEAHRLMFWISNCVAKFCFLLVMKAEDSQIR